METRPPENDHEEVLAALGDLKARDWKVLSNGVQYTADAELQVMSQCDLLLAGLCPNAQDRAVAWLEARMRGRTT